MKRYKIFLVFAVLVVMVLTLNVVVLATEKVTLKYTHMHTPMSVGGKQAEYFAKLIEEKTGITTMTAEEPMTCVAVGTGKFVEFLSGKR